MQFNLDIEWECILKIIPCCVRMWGLLFMFIEIYTLFAWVPFGEYHKPSETKHQTKQMHIYQPLDLGFSFPQ